MVLSKGLQSDDWVGGIILYFIFAAWAGFTLSILVMMEGLSAFLHTLRLHWYVLLDTTVVRSFRNTKYGIYSQLFRVEFMSKFYMGVGYPFQPFSFTDIIEAEETATE